MYSELRTEVLYCALRQASDFRGELRGLRARAVASLTFGVPIRSLLALFYRLSPGVDIVVDADAHRFKVSSPRAPWIPLPRHIVGTSYTPMTESAADRAFRAHARGYALQCSLYDLMGYSSELCRIARVGSKVDQSIAITDENLPTMASRSAADRLDFALLLLIGGSALSAWHAPAYEALLAIQASGESAESRTHWLSTVLERIGWASDASVLVHLMDNVLPLRVRPTVEERLLARSRIAMALNHV